MWQCVANGKWDPQPRQWGNVFCIHNSFAACVTEFDKNIKYVPSPFHYLESTSKQHWQNLIIWWVAILLMPENWLIFVIFGLLSFSQWWASSQLRSDQLIFSLWLCLCSHLYTHDVSSDWLVGAALGLSLVLYSHTYTLIIRRQSNLFVSNQN